MTRARKAKAPVPGASRCYVLTPVAYRNVDDEGDTFCIHGKRIDGYHVKPCEECPYTWAADRLTEKGWEVIEQDYKLAAADAVWIMVELWAIPPGATN